MVIMNNNETINLLLNKPLPPASIHNFSHISTKKADIEEWLSNLSLLNMAEISKQIKTTLLEISKFQTDAATKLDIMEAIRPAVHNLITSLKKHYLNQSLVLDSKAMKVANLVQTLKAYEFAIYNNIAQELIQKPEKASFNLGKLFNKSANKLALSLHRTITAAVNIIHETNLLYLSPIQGTWSKLHRLYLLADGQKLTNIKVLDAQVNHLQQETTIKETYIRAILMSIFRTNSLRQQEIQKLFEYTELWAHLVRDNNKPSTDDLFVADLKLDAEPLYITTDKSLSNTLLYINLQELMTHLNHIKENNGKPDNSSFQSYQTSLIEYALSSIEEPAERTTSRHPFEGKLIAAIGMVSCHYHISEQQKFNDVIKLDDYIKEQQSGNMLSDGFDSFGNEGDVDFHSNKTETNEQYQLGSVGIVDISPGGYRVTWNGDSPNNLKTGELICLREDSDKPWQVGVIRWVLQNPDEGADLGVEILSAKASTCGVMPNNHDDENLQFMRAIILPEIKALDRSATVLTPNYQFKDNHKITIRRGKANALAKLDEQYLKTQSFRQYGFTVIPAKKKSM